VFELGANAMVKDAGGMTPLQVALESDHRSVIEVDCVFSFLSLKTLRVLVFERRCLTFY